MVSWFFTVFGWFLWFFKLVSWFLVGFHGFSSWFNGFSWFLVGFHGFSRWFHGFSWLRTPKRYSLHPYLGPTIPLGLAGRRPALA